MKTQMDHASLIRQPSVYLPLLVSLAALALVLSHAAIFGTVHEEHEGTAAHLWQILMGGQLPILAYFMLKWLPKRTTESLLILALLGGLWLANFATVYWLTE